MVFVDVQFVEDDGRSIALVSKAWLTPKKREVFWPPFKSQIQFNKSLKSNEIPDENSWELCQISKCYFECDDFEKARKKLKLLEETSDIQSDALESGVTARRKRQPPRRFSNDSASDENSTNDGDANILPRPPKLKTSVSRRLDQSFTSSQAYSSCSIQKNQLQPTISYGSSLLNTPSSSIRSEFIQQSSSCNTSPRSLATPTSTASSDATGFQFQFITLLAQVKEQNNQILALIKKQYNSNNTTSLHILPENLPIQLPVNSQEDLYTLELFLKNKDDRANLCSYLSTLGGRDLTANTNNVLRNLMSDHLASLYSFKGSRNEKRAFEDLLLKDVIIRASKLSYPSATEKKIEDDIKIWLKHAPGRVKQAQKQARKTN